MSIDKNSSVAELRSELDRKRKRALDLQMSATDPDEWKNLNAIRWELEDLDRDLYLSQFIKNNEKLEKLIGLLEAAGEGAKKIVETLDEIKNAVKLARSTLKTASSIFPELDAFYTEVENMLKMLRA
jgi:uncharacterized phage infection (PIP) family protein YhgE